MNVLKELFRWIMRLFQKRVRAGQSSHQQPTLAEPAPSLTVATVEELPAEIGDGALYILGEAETAWSIAFRCPCGCHALIQLNLLEDASPSWRLSREAQGSVTLSPSIWRQVGCRSHFYVRHSRVVWVPDLGTSALKNSFN